MAKASNSAGRLVDVVSIQRKSEISDGGGGTTFSWEAVTGLTGIRGQFVPEGGRERLQNERLQSEVQGTLKIRTSTAARSITAADRAVINGVNYRIRAVMHTDRAFQFVMLDVERGGAT